MKCESLFSIAVTLVAAPESDQAAFIGVGRLAEGEQLPLAHSCGAGEGCVIGEQFEVGGEIEELHGANP